MHTHPHIHRHLAASLLALTALTTPACEEKADPCSTPAISLEYDCRCDPKTNGKRLPGCQSFKDITETQPSLGSGPSPYLMAREVIGAGKIRNGEVWADRGEIIMAVSMGSNQPGWVMGLNIETGDRRVISGWYLDFSEGEKQVGEGPYWGEPKWARRGPDNMIYVYTTGYRRTLDDFDPQNNSYYMVWKVDPDTGTRTLHWQHDASDRGFGQCDNGDSVDTLGKPVEPDTLQLEPGGDAFEVLSDGAMLFATIGNGVHRPGEGMIEISPDGKSCRHVTLTKGHAKNDYGDGIGGGIDVFPQFYSIQEIDGKILTIDNDSLIEVDRQTGKRTRLADKITPGQLELDKKRNVYHLTAIVPPKQPFYGVIDVDTKEQFVTSGCFTIEADHPFALGCLDYDGASVALDTRTPGWMLPDGEHMIMAASGGRFVKIDIDTGVANHFSY